MRLAKIMTPVVAVFVLAACGPSQEEPSDSTDGAPVSSEAAETGNASGKECVAADFSVEGELDAPPEITVPDDCDPPTELLVEDVVAGDGAKVTEGDTAEVHYRLVGFSNGEQVDSSWDRGQTFPVQNVGQAQVIEGWNKGLVGMEDGARRLLVVPPELGYGGSGNELAEETLVFVIDLVKVS